FRYSNASGHDLWSSLQEASRTDVSRIMEGWISQEGFPVVKASLVDGRLTLEQERFLLTGGTSKQTWPIPVTMNVDGKTQSLLLDKKRAEVNLPKAPRSLKLNVDQTGFYVVQYNGKELLDLVWKSGLSQLDRWGLISAARLTLLDDAYAKKAGSKLNDLANVEPDMKRSVVMGYARSSNDYDCLIGKYTKSTTDEERLRYLEGLASFKNPELVAKTLDF